VLIRTEFTVRQQIMISCTVVGKLEWKEEKKKGRKGTRERSD
jgi:hypothetical protein